MSRVTRGTFPDELLLQLDFLDPSVRVLCPPPSVSNAMQQSRIYVSMNVGTISDYPGNHRLSRFRIPQNMLVIRSFVPLRLVSKSKQNLVGTPTPAFLPVGEMGA